MVPGAVPYSAGADISCMCREAGMFAIRSRRRIVTERRDFLDAVEKVIRGYKKFSAVAKYEAYNH
jgi:26S proteasome regulatory subunit T1